MLMASSYSLVRTLTTAEPSSSRIRGFLNWKVNNRAGLNFTKAEIGSYLPLLGSSDLHVRLGFQVFPAVAKALEREATLSGVPPL